MKKTVLNFLVLFMMTYQTTTAQQEKITYPLKEDVSTIDGIMKASYEVVSGPAGAVRQWERDLSLHHPSAVYSFIEYKNDTPYQVVMSLKDFHKETDAMVAVTAFYEQEVTKEVRVFGNIAHVWSTYETRLIKDGPVVRRGINSVQLFYDQGRWWILSWTFDKENEQRKIPQSFDKN